MFISDNDFSTARDACTIPTLTPQKGDGMVHLLAKLTKVFGGSAGGTSSGAPTHINSTITTGGTAQTLQAATARKYFYVRNTSAGDLRLTFDGTTTPAAAVGLLLKTGEAWESPSHWVPQALIKVWGATTAQAYEAISA